MTVEDLISFRAQLSFDKSGSVRFPFYFCSFHQRSRSGMVEKRDKKRRMQIAPPPPPPPLPFEWHR